MVSMHASNVKLSSLYRQGWPGNTNGYEIDNYYSCIQFQTHCHFPRGRSIKEMHAKQEIEVQFLLWEVAHLRLPF